MKSLIALFVLSTALAAWAHTEDIQSETYYLVDLDEMLADKELLTHLFGCIVEDEECAPEMEDLKELIINALENECVDCNEEQIDGTRKIFGHFINNEPEYWTKLIAKYDPDNKFSAKYENELREVQASNS